MCMHIVLTTFIKNKFTFEKLIITEDRHALTI